MLGEGARELSHRHSNMGHAELSISESPYRNLSYNQTRADEPHDHHRHHAQFC